jgi:GNAT superfamily N-acetyltransferase
MTRAPVTVRDVEVDDAEALQAIWEDFAVEPNRATRVQTSLEQIRRAIGRLHAEPAERLLLAVVDNTPVGVAHLRRGPLSPIHEEDAVHVGYLHVLSGHRRRGVGRHLLDAAATWAEEKETTHIVASVAATARDANRFLARLGLSQVAVVRAASVAQLRSKLTMSGAKTPASNVVAVRRLMRSSRRSRWDAPGLSAPSRGR